MAMKNEHDDKTVIAKRDLRDLLRTGATLTKTGIVRMARQQSVRACDLLYPTTEAISFSVVCGEDAFEICCDPAKYVGWLVGEARARLGSEIVPVMNLACVDHVYSLTNLSTGTVLHPTEDLIGATISLDDCVRLETAAQLILPPEEEDENVTKNGVQISVVSSQLVEENVSKSFWSSTAPSYATYAIIGGHGNDAMTVVPRRYNEFKSFHATLVKLKLQIADDKTDEDEKSLLPALPESSLLRDVTPGYLEDMRTKLDQYLRALSKLPAVVETPAFTDFVGGDHAGVPSVESGEAI
jgi:hypothetical protein